MFNDDKTPKRRIEVFVELLDSGRIDGVLFVSPQGRISDLLNDDRLFLPFETAEGSVTFLRKSSILRVTPVDVAKPEAENSKGTDAKFTTLESESTDPYELLGVAAGSSVEVLREAYRRRCREYHPDRLQALGLPKEFIELATRRMAAINAAYDSIGQQRAK
jgi:DnaJ domain